MEVRTFEAVNMREALKAIKAHYGRDAVILSTKAAGLPSGEQGVIVTATGTVKEHGWSGASAKSNEVDLSGYHAKLDQVIDRVASLENRLRNDRAIEALDEAIKDIKLLLLENLRTKEGSSIENLPPEFVPIERQLRVLSVDDVYIAKLLRDIMPRIKTEGVVASEEKVRDLALKWFYERVKIAPKLVVDGTHTVINVFVGPPGSGKTSALAKIAAHYHHKEKKKVLLVALDACKLAAVEQLRVFARILDVPFKSVESASDLAKQLGAHRDADLVLIDTPGCDLRRREEIKEVLSLNEGTIPLDTSLVLSATENQVYNDHAVRSFAPMGIQNIVFTRLDEAFTLGQIFNLSYKWSIPLSFFSKGQSIPEHIERASKERILERLFRI